MYRCLRRGPTAYEWQIGRLWGHFVHLMGGDWKRWLQWDRIIVRWEKSDGTHINLIH